MSRTVQVLAILLLVQIVIAIGLFSRGDDKGAFIGGEKLLGLDLSRVDEITLSEKEEESVVLNKQRENWVLSSFHDFPVSQDKLNEITDSLFTVTKGWPVATTKTAMKRFRVLEQDFERKLLFSKGGQLVKTLYLGSSPGFKQVHARVEGDNNTYLIDFSLFQASMKSADWQDKEVLKHNKDEFVKLTTAEFTLERQTDSWIVSGLQSNEETSQKDVEEYVSRIANLTFVNVLGKEDKPEYKQDNPEFSITAVLKSGKTLDYRFSAMGEGEDYALKLSGLDYYFKLSKHSIDDLEVKRDQFVKTKKTEEKNDAE